MSWCAVINCNNKTKNDREVSYFRLPKVTSVHKDWIHVTGRHVTIDNLPSKILICSEHFEEKCFDPSWKLQNELYYKDCQISRWLLAGSIPTLLHHKKDNKPRLSSVKRALAQRKEEVIYCFNKVVTGPQGTALLKKDPRHRFFFQGFCINFQNFAT